MITKTQPKDVSVYINDTFWRLQNSTFIDEGFFFERSTAKRYNIGTDFRTYRGLHRIDNHLSIKFNYQKGQYINIYTN